MKRLTLLAILAAGLGWTSPAAAFDGFFCGPHPDWRCKYAGDWNAGYYSPTWGVPMAVLVPPNAEAQTKFTWGVPASRVTPICHQFQPYPTPGGPGSVYDGRQFRPTPPWPSATDQLGYYYVRGPW